jgi:uncharacterized membrane protein YfcA
MNIYLPIAEVSVNPFLLLGLGGSVGFLSGVFGVGGGFLMTPLLIFIGIPPAVAVGTELNQIVALSSSAVLAHWRRRAIDVRMGLVLVAGGVVGSAIGVQAVHWLRARGQIELAISLCYVVFLGIIGTLMLIESVRALWRAGRGRPARRHRHHWSHGLPLRMRFRASHLYISAIPPFAVGAFVGVLSAIMGVGGGIIMVPAMVYLLGMAATVVVGTSLFQLAFVTGASTLMHATVNHNVDGLLVVLLLIGGVIGAQFGARVGPRLRGDELRVLLALLVLLICLKLGADLVRTPPEMFLVGEGRP